MNAPLEALDDSSLSDRVLDRLVKAIRDGHFRSGRLPSEPELAQQLGVSRTTVRSALQALDQIGMLQRRPGAGTRVRPHVSPEVLAIHGLVPFSKLLALHHEEVETTSVLAADVEADEERRERLGAAPDATLHEITREIRADGRLAFVLVELIPDEVLAKPIDPDALGQSILTLARDLFRRPIDHAVAHLVPAVATGETAAHFGLPDPAPLMCVKEIFYDRSGEVIALSDFSVNPDLVEFSVVRQGKG